MFSFIKVQDNTNKYIFKTDKIYELCVINIYIITISITDIFQSQITNNNCLRLTIHWIMVFLKTKSRHCSL